MPLTESATLSPRKRSLVLQKDRAIIIQRKARIATNEINWSLSMTAHQAVEESRKLTARLEQDLKDELAEEQEEKAHTRS